MPPGKQDLELCPKLWTVMTLLFGEGGCFLRAPGHWLPDHCLHLIQCNTSVFSPSADPSRTEVS